MGFQLKAQHLALYQLFAGIGPFWVGLVSTFGAGQSKEYWEWLLSKETPNYNIHNPWYLGEANQYLRQGGGAYDPAATCAASWSKVGGQLLAFDCDGWYFAYACEKGALLGFDGICVCGA